MQFLSIYSSGTIFRGTGTAVIFFSFFLFFFFFFAKHLLHWLREDWLFIGGLCAMCSIEDIAKLKVVKWQVFPVSNENEKWWDQEFLVCENFSQFFFLHIWQSLIYNYYLDIYIKILWQNNVDFDEKNRDSYLYFHYMRSNSC